MRNFASLWRVVLVCSFTASTGGAHEHTLPLAAKKQRQLQDRVLAQVAKDRIQKEQTGVCQLTIQIFDRQTQKSLPANIRLTDLESHKPLALPELISRPKGWFSSRGLSTVEVPQRHLSVAAFHGIGSVMAERTVDLRGRPSATVRIPLERFYRPADRRWVSGNTHLHLNRMTRSEADHYLQVVPAADSIDLLYVSHLVRAIEDETYITNSYNARSLADLSTERVTLRYGEEHRHNLKAHGEGYGHVMLLDISRLIEPVSIGPGLTQKGTDGIPLNRGIRQARADGASVIWCHNSFGLEDLPNWMLGVVHAQNIHDGGPHGSYKDTFYRYLNIGLRVPFSTGTDWLVYDLSRVFVPLPDGKSSAAWLNGLAAGQSYITNGPFLELQTEQHQIGDTIAMTNPGSVVVTGRALGRQDFRHIELVQNGNVVHSVSCHQSGKTFEASMKYELRIDEPGWFALRIPLENKVNEFGEALFAHTSAIYVELAGQLRFEREVAQQLLTEMERNQGIIKRMATFKNKREEAAVLQVHRNGIQAIQSKLRSAGFPTKL